MKNKNGHHQAAIFLRRTKQGEVSFAGFIDEWKEKDLIEAGNTGLEILILTSFKPIPAIFQVEER